MTAPPDGALADAKAYLRLDTDDEDALVVTLIGAAMALCERFTGLTLMAGARTDRVVASAPCWIRLPATPVATISTLSALDAAGGSTLLGADGYAIDIDAAGDGWVRLIRPIPESRLAVGYVAGLATDWPSLAEPLRQGIVRLVAHLFAHRDDTDDSGPPVVVAALWRPFRRMRLA